MAPAAMEMASRLARRSPKFHGSGTVQWNASPAALQAIAASVDARTSSIETGCGASTVVFAAAGAAHRVVTPDREEFERVEEYCRDNDVDPSRLVLVEGYSDQVLPLLPAGEVDFALIDGAHSYPVPALDFHYLSRRLRVGGLLLLDDVWIPAVAGVFAFMSAEPSWQCLQILDDHAALFRRVGPDVTAGGDFWRGQGINRTFPDFSFLPLHRRVWPEARKQLAAWRARRTRPVS